MSFDQQITLILVGAGISLISSLFTIIATSLLNHWLTDRANQKAKKAKAAYSLAYFEALSAAKRKSVDEGLEQLNYYSDKNPTTKEYHLDVLLGFQEAWIKYLQDEGIPGADDKQDNSGGS